VRHRQLGCWARVGLRGRLWAALLRVVPASRPATAAGCRGGDGASAPDVLRALCGLPAAVAPGRSGPAHRSALG
jgi:hypothetical protein